jgi:hypothetical protein
VQCVLFVMHLTTLFYRIRIVRTGHPASRDIGVVVKIADVQAAVVKRV